MCVCVRLLCGCGYHVGGAIMWVWPMSRNCLPIFKVLVLHGGDMTIPDSEGNTPLSIASPHIKKGFTRKSFTHPPSLPPHPTPTPTYFTPILISPTYPLHTNSHTPHNTHSHPLLTHPNLTHFTPILISPTSHPSTYIHFSLTHTHPRTYTLSHVLSHVICCYFSFHECEEGDHISAKRGVWHRNCVSCSMQRYPV